MADATELPTVSRISRATIETTTYQVSLPSPASISEMQDAIEIAREEWAKSYGPDGCTEETFVVRNDGTRIAIEWGGPVSTTGGIH